MVQIGSQDRLSYSICLTTCLERPHCPTEGFSRLFAELGSNLSCLYISHCESPSLEVLKVIGPLPATLQLQLLVQGGRYTTKGRREAHEAPDSHKRLLLYHVTPQHLPQTFTQHHTPVPFCSAAACRSPSRREATYIRKGGEDPPELPGPRTCKHSHCSGPNTLPIIPPNASPAPQKKLHWSD